jgi:hypothetical protein
MILAAAWYTILIVCLNVIVMGGGSNLFLPDDFATFTQKDIEERIYGSKIVIVSEQVRFLNQINAVDCQNAYFEVTRLCSMSYTH